MIFGISTSCFYPELTEKAAAWIAQNHTPAAEVFFNAPSELQPDYLRELRKVLQSGGTQVISVHPFTSGLEPLLLFSEYERRFDDGLDFYRKYFEAAAYLGASYVVLHGDRKESKTPWEFYFERYFRLDSAAKTCGVRILQENVERCKAGRADFLTAMKKALPDALFVLDLKQARRAGEDLFTLLEILGTSIRHIHMSGCGPEEDCLPLHRGDFDCRKFFRVIKEKQIADSAVMELYRGNYGEYSQLSRSVAIMQEIWNSLEN